MQCLFCNPVKILYFVPYMLALSLKDNLFLYVLKFSEFALLAPIIIWGELVSNSSACVVVKLPLFFYFFTFCSYYSQ